MSLRSGRFAEWLLAPHNDHFEPFVKGVLYLNFQLFGLAALLPIHALILLSLAACIVLLYRFAVELFETSESALLAAAIFGLSSLTAKRSIQAS